jgi:hypothetical protein
LLLLCLLLLSLLLLFSSHKCAQPLNVPQVTPLPLVALTTLHGMTTDNTWLFSTRSTFDQSLSTSNNSQRNPDSLATSTRMPAGPIVCITWQQAAIPQPNWCVFH